MRCTPTLNEAPTSVMSVPEYEQHARRRLPAILLERCGLDVVRGVDANRNKLERLQWNFRAPVLIAATAPHPNTELGVFEVLPSKPHYMRPDAVAPRHVTPIKFGESPAAPPRTSWRCWR